jgi:predicted nucleic acid-binding protein
VNEPRPLRVLLDVNILISDVLSRAAGKQNTTSQKLVDAMLAGMLGDRPTQMILSIAMLETFQTVLIRLGADASVASEAAQALLDMTRHGPDALDPYLLLDSSNVPFALTDREDAAILATAFAAKADLLLTDNLGDFEHKGCTMVPTSLARHADGRTRQLSCQIHHSPDGHRLVVAHPLDILARATQGRALTFDEIA